MGATDELRRLLDERGVEWRYKDERTTYWYGTLDGEEWGEWTATEMGGHLHLTFSANGDVVTPEQAIAATLGATDTNSTQAESSGTCHDEGTFNSWGLFTCSNCSIVFPLDAVKDAPSIGRTLPPKYCPNCGRRVEQ